MKTIDMLGQPCPIPVIQAKKALAEGDVDAVAVMVDNIVAVQNLQKMADGMGYAFEHEQQGADRYIVKIGKTEGQARNIEAPAAETGLPVRDTAGDDNVNRVTVLVTADHMGRGSEELGRILIKGYLFSLTQLEVPPKAVLFINSGVKLTSGGANTVDDLRELEKKGTSIYSCGTCLNYFGLTEQLGVGEIVDMYAISTALAEADKVVSL